MHTCTCTWARKPAGNFGVMCLSMINFFMSSTIGKAGTCPINGHLYSNTKPAWSQKGIIGKYTLCIKLIILQLGACISTMNTLSLLISCTCVYSGTSNKGHTWIKDTSLQLSTRDTFLVSHDFDVKWPLNKGHLVLLKVQVCYSPKSQWCSLFRGRTV